MRKSSYIITTIFISIILTALGGELLVRLLIPAETFWPLHSNIYQTVENEIGYIHQPNLHRNAFGVVVRTNSLGFRGPEWSLQKSPGTYRIALIGDSHAFGFGVVFEQTVGEVLAELLTNDSTRQYEVLNFAANGYNSQQQLAVLRHYVLSFQPDLILVIASSNDHQSPLFVDEQGWLHSSQQAAQRKRQRGRHPGNLSSWQKHSRLVLYFYIWQKRWQAAQTERQALNVQATEYTQYPDGWWMKPFSAGPVPENLLTTVYQPLQAMVAEARQQFIPIIIANFNGILDYRRLFQQLGTTLQVPTLELLALFPEARDWPHLLQLFSLGWDSHLNSIAHRRWAVALVALIRQQQALVALSLLSFNTHIPYFMTY